MWLLQESRLKPELYFCKDTQKCCLVHQLSVVCLKVTFLLLIPNPSMYKRHSFSLNKLVSVLIRFVHDVQVRANFGKLAKKQNCQRSSDIHCDS